MLATLLLCVPHFPYHHLLQITRVIVETYFRLINSRDITFHRDLNPWLKGFRGCSYYIA